MMTTERYEAVIAVRTPEEQDEAVRRAYAEAMTGKPEDPPPPRRVPQMVPDGSETGWGLPDEKERRRVAADTPEGDGVNEPMWDSSGPSVDECACGHMYDEHRHGGPCMVEDWYGPCPCVHFDAEEMTPTCRWCGHPIYPQRTGWTHGPHRDSRRSCCNGQHIAEVMAGSATPTPEARGGCRHPGGKRMTLAQACYHGDHAGCGLTGCRCPCHHPEVAVVTQLEFARHGLMLHTGARTKRRVAADTPKENDDE